MGNVETQDAVKDEEITDDVRAVCPMCQGFGTITDQGSTPIGINPDDPDAVPCKVCDGSGDRTDALDAKDAEIARLRSSDDACRDIQTPRWQ